MKTLEELKKTWDINQSCFSIPQPYNQQSFEKTIDTRVKKHMNAAMHYFWASFTLQMIVYALLCHVMVKYWSDTESLAYSVAGVILNIPFTYMLLKKFKTIARLKPTDSMGTSLHQYVLSHYTLLNSFYRFKKLYEWMLIPLSSAIGVMLVFKLYVPGGVYEHPTGAAITFVFTILSCVWAIISENKIRFIQPLQHLQGILEEFKNTHPTD